MRVAVSIVRFRIFSVESITAPSTAVAPPDRLVPAPRVITGIPWAAHHRTTTWTSAVVTGRMSAIGVPASGSLARSWR
ncbi:Uncharacterised protein [Mycobacteroides abscessus subsp. abscessus]|nr:Uncharacterised protein [Mycobacteroides abscessus subsp. abscessus]